jgi:hypothetical protein
MFQMKSLRFFPLFLGAVAILAFPGCGSLSKAGPFHKDVPKTIRFERDIRPFLEARCLECHQTGKAMRNLNLETLQKANSTWRGGPVIVAKSPDRSMLVQVLSLNTDEHPDTLSGHSISFADREKLITWIREGAEWPDAAPLRPRSP